MQPATRWTQEDYDRAAAQYLARLRPQQIMEAQPTATQRKITLSSLAVVEGSVEGFHVFNELLVQFFFQGRLRQVVPDNMVVRGHLADRMRRSYSADDEGVPFWVLEYVSQGHLRKDYTENHRLYEQELKVPYYLLFYPDEQDLRLYRRGRAKYARVKPNREGRLPIPECEIEVALLDGWVRFWFRGKLVALPAQLHQRLEETEQRLEDAEKSLDIVTTVLRPLIETRARAAGRRDILDRLSTTTDAEQLARWAAELG